MECRQKIRNKKGKWNEDRAKGERASMWIAPLEMEVRKEKTD
jgi:hypothetical protein